MIIALEEAKYQLIAMRDTLKELGEALRVEELQAKVAELEAQTLVIEQAIAALSDPGERLVMRERYIFGKNWHQVCSTLIPLGYSERTIYRLHGFALLHLKEV